MLNEVSSPIAVVVLPDNTLQATVYTPFNDNIQGYAQMIVNQYASSTGGDMNGPNLSVNNNIAVFNGTTGKIVKDGGMTVSEILDESLINAIIFG